MSFTEVLAQLAVNLRLDSSQFATGSSRAAASAKKLEQNLGGLPKGVTAITGALGGLAGTFATGVLVGGVAELGAKLVELGKGAIEHAASLHVTSQQLGVTTDDLQRYRFAAGQVGLEQDKVDLGLKRLNKSIGLADKGLGPGAKAFAAMGISVRDAAGHLKTVGEIMPEIAGYIAKLPDPAARAALEFQLFGRSGQDMAPLLNVGAQGVKNLTSAADKAGAVISPQLIERAHELEVKFTKLKTVIETKVEAGLLTGIEKIGEAADGIGTKVQAADDWLAKLQASADEWDKKNSGFTKSQFLGQFATEPLAAFDKMLAHIQTSADDLDKKLGTQVPKGFFDSLTQEMLGTTKADENWRAHLFATLDAIPGKLQGAWQAFDHWDQSIQASTHKMVTGVESDLKSRLSAAIDSIKPKLEAAGDWFHTLYDRVVGHSYVPDMVDGIAAQMQRLDAVMVAPIKGATAKASSAFHDMAQQLSSLLSQLFPAAAEIDQFAKDTATLDWGKNNGQLTPDQWLAARAEAFGRFMDQALPALHDAKDTVKGIGDAVDDAGNSFDQWSATALSTTDKVGRALEGLSNLVGKVFGQKAGGIFGALVEAFSAVSGAIGAFRTPIPQLQATNPSGANYIAPFGGGRALGGPVVPGKMYRVGENGPEYVSFGSAGYVHPNKASNDGGLRIQVVKGDLFDVIVDRRASNVAAPLAGRAALSGAAGGYAAVRRKAERTFP